MSAMSGASAAERSAAWERGPESPPEGISSASAAADAEVVVLTKARLGGDVSETMGAVDRACPDSGRATARRKDRLLNFIWRLPVKLLCVGCVDLWMVAICTVHIRGVMFVLSLFCLQKSRDLVEDSFQYRLTKI